MQHYISQSYRHFLGTKNGINLELKEMLGTKDKINEQFSNLAEDEDNSACRQP